MVFEAMTVGEIKQHIEAAAADEVLIEKLLADKRSSVQRLAKGLERQLADRSRVAAMYRYEHSLQAKGCQAIAGMDEAGRGPLAGPVVIAAVILPPDLYIPKINDSKKLSAKVRDELYDYIMANAREVQRTFVDEREIDAVNIYQATVHGMYQTLRSFTLPPDGALIDAVPLPELTIPSESIIKGDANSASIAAASIIAKVERDRYMDELDKLYPMYGFAKHKGYGTAEHVAAIHQYGPCPIHRRTFEPIKSLLEQRN